MLKSARRAAWTLGSLVVLGLGAAVLTPSNLSDPYYIDPAPLAAALQRSPNFTPEQNRALLRQIRMQQHPSWRSLPPLVRLQRAARIALKTLTSSASSTPPNANFIGNTTLVSTSDSFLGLQRETDCSLTLFDGNATFTTSTSYPTFQIEQSTPHYEQVLHTEAGLATTPDSVTTCTDATLGLGSRRGAYLGKTSSGNNLLAWTAYNSFHNGNALYSTVINTASTQVQTSNADFSALSMFQLTFGDLNGDGIADVIGLDQGDTTLHVWLANANGTLGAPTTYSLPGSTTEAAVVADVNGDGKADVVVATRDTTTNQETISVLTGTGTGTLNAPQSFTVATATDSAGAASYLVTLVAADFRGNNRVDLIGSNGIVLLNNGSGAFTVGTSAFPAITATSSFGPNMAAGDFNKDGKLDLAVNDGVTTYIYLGNGDGTFTAGAAYVGDASVGYLAASDLDGDGNLDLWIGSGDGGVFLGDQFGLNEGYAMMGNGNGSFQGAPFEPFVYTGFNVAALTGKTILGAVGVNASGTLTSYTGDGKGNFNTQSTFSISTIYQGQTIGPGGDGSFALGDVNGDGIPDLVYNSGYTSGGNPAPGVLIALGNGQGGFGTPTFYPVPSTLAAGDIDEYWTISDVRVADLNGDGKADLVYSYTDTSFQKGITYSGTVAQLSSGNGTFQAPLMIPYQSAAYSSSGSTQPTVVQVITDLNKDGIPDILSLGGTSTHNIYTGSALIQVALGKGDGTFGTPTTVATIQIESVSGFGPTLVTGDMNGDGIPDILALTADASENAQLEVWLGNGDGTYKAPIITSYAAQYLNTGQTLAVADFNGDGKLDVAIFDPYTPTDNGISFGNGDGTFQTIAATNTALTGALPAQAILVNAFGTALASDFNGDGKPDLLVGATLLLSQASTSSGPAGTTTALTVAPNPATVGQSVTLTAKVTSTVTGTPSGTVEFLDGTTVLGSQPLAAAGTATLTVSTLGAGAHSLTAQYSGNTTFAASTSSAVSLTVNAAMPAFAVAASPALGSVAPGSSVTTTVTLTPSGGFTGNVALSCTGLPTGATCTFSPSSVTLGAGASTSTLSIATAGQTAALNGIPWAPGGLVLAVFLIPLFRSGRVNAQTRVLAWAALLAIGAGGLHGCGGSGNSGSSNGGGSGGGSGGTPAGTYPIVITATAGTTTHTVNYTLTVT
jgi:Bacterial Ig-like domain (group 3)/FG-GAP-like repeat/FG-GAP repeat